MLAKTKNRKYSNLPMPENLTATIFFMLFFVPAAWSQNCVLKGSILDATSNEAVSFARVLVSGTSQGAVADESGHFVISGLKPGFVRIEVSSLGYKQSISPEIELSNARTAFVEIRLEKLPEEIEEVQVRGSAFRKTEESPLSLKTINLSEIESSPGANRDISKVVQSFAGVLSTPAYRNDVIIRGGGPSESRFYLDGVEVPNINHFATQGASGGPVGIINADLIREVNFYSGAFPANRGNALSGVLEFFQVDGNPDQFRFRGTVGASEISATIDGPVNNKTSFVLSARRSYLKLLFSALELPFLPTFNDTQFKLKSRIDKNNEISLIGLGAIDLSDLNLGIKNPDDQQKYILSYLPVNKQWSYTLGLVYKHYRDNSTSTVVFSRSHLNNSNEKYLENDYSSQNHKILDYSSNKIENKFRVENTARTGNVKISGGANLDWVEYDNSTFQRRYAGTGIQDISYQASLSFAKWGIFGQVSPLFADGKITASAGFRFDANSYSASMQNLFRQFSPRVSASYAFANRWSLNLNAGRYFQLPSLTTLGFQKNDVLVNKNNKLKYIQSGHLIGGIEYKPNAVMQFSLEGFSKKYNYYPFSVTDSISLANKGADFGIVGDEEVISASKGKAAGAEFQARVNSPSGLNFNLSVTFVRSKFQDKSGRYSPSSWDSKQIVSLTTTRNLKKGWKVGARWRFVGGLPYTPYDLEKSSLVRVWNLSGAPLINYQKLNSERFHAFHQLDVRVDKAWYWNKLTTKLYLDIQNLYNFKARQTDIVVREQDEAGNYLLTDNNTRYVLRTVKNTSGTVLPTIGLMVEF
jgi:outer membrane receptor for ferrienterochelin and colicin